MQHVQMLALVFMDALGLHVVQAVRIDVDAAEFLDGDRQGFLALALDVAPARLEVGIIGMRLQRPQFFQVVFPSRRRSFR